MKQDVGEAKIRVVYIEKIKSGLERRDVGRQGCSNRRFYLQK